MQQSIAGGARERQSRDFARALAAWHDRALKPTTSTALLAVFRSRRMAILFALGFASGTPYFLTSQTLQAWMSSIGVDTGRIAALSAVGLAYTFKFLWAPLLDRFRLPLLGRHGAVVCCSCSRSRSVIAICVLGSVDPAAIAIPAVIVALLSASQDVVLDAYNADVLAPHERAAGSAVYVLGYRVAMFVTSSVALVMADHLPWRVVYFTMAALMSLGIIATLLADEPPPVPRPASTLLDAITRPFLELGHRLGARGTAWLLAFAALYQFGYYFGQSLLTRFFNGELGFSLTELGTINKGCILAGVAIGGLAGGGLVARFGVRRMLVGFGAFAASTHLLYALLAIVGHSTPLLCVTVVVDSAANAMATAAFVAVLMSACSPAVSATQFALLTSLSSVGLRVFGPFAGHVVASIGWSGFFITTALTALPGLAIAWWARDEPTA